VEFVVLFGCRGGGGNKDEGVVAVKRMKVWWR
jgi:hypothetical protein